MMTFRITIEGLVQGVGFRPFIYRIAREEGLRGWVNNTNENVQVCLNAAPDQLERFLERIRTEAPPAAEIEAVDVATVPEEAFEDFRILESESRSDAVTEVSPDLAVCEDCLRDMRTRSNRLAYPFLNCTNCGPRFTIIRDLPYDRQHTTMSVFEMCPECRAEYEDVMDRRFHAQPTACRKCGPRYTLVENTAADRVGADHYIASESAATEPDAIPARTAALIDAGELVTVKGMGGFFMACDATNEDAVRRLRQSKHREGKPFAVMFSTLEAVRRVCRVDPAEAGLLESWRRPIVILRNLRGGAARPASGDENAARQLAHAVSNGFPTTGAMLPYMPFHHLLFAQLKTPAIVMTSGNLSEEPIEIDNQRATAVLGPVSAAVLQYNREIHNRNDDSVAMIVNETPRLLRRSRGYVPSPVRLAFDTEGIFATGAELVNCFAIGKGCQAILSQHIGDLQNFETYEFYRETAERFKRLFRFRARRIVHDLHPDYLSTRYALETDLPRTGVQHHHAHIASVLAEHRADEKVIGIAFDGTGLGDDGNIWGSEFLVCDLQAYERYSHLAYLPMPGGDKAVHEPWRLAVSLLYQVHGRHLTGLGLPFLQAVEKGELDGVLQALEKNINCPLSSGAGRLFDAVAALTGICTHSSFHAEAPMRLESVIMEDAGSYDFTPGEVIETRPLTEAIVRDIRKGADPGLISARFHNTIIRMIRETVHWMSKETGIRKAAISGGSFQNRYVLSGIESRLGKDGVEVLAPRRVPANDGGIALGQLAVAAQGG